MSFQKIKTREHLNSSCKLRSNKYEVFGYAKTPLKEEKKKEDLALFSFDNNLVLQHVCAWLSESKDFDLPGIEPSPRECHSITNVVKRPPTPPTPTYPPTKGKHR